MLLGHPRQTTLFVETAKDSGYDVETAWKARDGRKSNAMSLGKCLTQVHAASFVIGTVLKNLLAILSWTYHRKAGIVTGSELALTEIQIPRPWARRTITDAKRHAKRVEKKRWYSTLTGLSSSASSNGSKVAGTVAQRAAKQPTKAMRSALLSHIA